MKMPWTCLQETCLKTLTTCQLTLSAVPSFNADSTFNRSAKIDSSHWDSCDRDQTRAASPTPATSSSPLSSAWCAARPLWSYPPMSWKSLLRGLPRSLTASPLSKEPAPASLCQPTLPVRSKLNRSLALWMKRWRLTRLRRRWARSQVPSS